MAFVHEQSCECFKSELDLFSVPLTQTSVSLARNILQMHSPVSTGFERIKFKLAVLVYRALHSTAPQYLSGQLQYVANLRSRCRGRLHSSTSSLLDVRPSRLVTVRYNSFAAAQPRLWNSLPVDVQSPPSLTTFCQKLKTFISTSISRDCFFKTALP